MNKRQRRKQYKKHLTSLADGYEFKSSRAKLKWITDNLNGDGTMFTRYYLKGEPESPFMFLPNHYYTKVEWMDK